MVDEERAEFMRAVERIDGNIKCIVDSVQDHEKRITAIESGVSVRLDHLAKDVSEIKADLSGQIGELRAYWAKAMLIMLLALIGLAGGPRLVEVIAKALGAM